MIHSRKKVTLVLDVEESIETSSGHMVAKLSHPSLEGYLHFPHSPKGGKEEFLQALDGNVVNSVLDVVTVIGGFIDGKSQQSAKKRSETAYTASGL